MRQNHRRASLHPRIGIGGVAGDLLVANRNKFNRAFGQCGQHGNVGMATKPEDMAYLAAFETITNVARREARGDTAARVGFGLVRRRALGAASRRQRSCHAFDKNSQA